MLWTLCWGGDGGGGEGGGNGGAGGDGGGGGAGATQNDWYKSLTWMMLTFISVDRSETAGVMVRSAPTSVWLMLAMDTLMITSSAGTPRWLAMRRRKARTSKASRLGTWASSEKPRVGTVDSPGERGG